MRKLRAIFLALFLSVTATSATGCAGWIAELRSNPLMAITDAVGYIRSALSLASGAFEIWASANPDQAVAARTQFNNIVNEVNSGLLVAQDGLHIAADASQPTIDDTALLRDSRSAMGNLSTFLSGLRNFNGRTSAANPIMQRAVEECRRASQVR